MGEMVPTRQELGEFVKLQKERRNFRTDPRVKLLIGGVTGRK